jgi:hypothetical protein
MMILRVLMETSTGEAPNAVFSRLILIGFLSLS